MVPVRVASPLLVGRERELAALGATLSAARRGEASLTFVAGEAGVGKTRLLRELERLAAADGMGVLHGDCVELKGGEFPYAPVVGALRDADPGALSRALGHLPPAGRAEIARLIPEVAPDPGPAATDDRPSQYAQGRLYELLLALLRHLAAEAPLLLVIEDGHWADHATRDVIAFLARNLSHDRMAVLVTYRSDELDRRHPLRVLVGEAGRWEQVERIALERLGRADVEHQLDAILGRAADEQLVDELFARSEGNPFFVEELLAAREAGDGGELPESVRDVLLLRVESLPPSTLPVVRALGALGRPGQHDLLAAVSGVAEPELSEALRVALGGHILLRRSEDDAFAFRHALMREAVRADLMPGELRALHARIAEALIAGGEAAAAELAFHLEAAGDRDAALAARIEAALDAERVYAFAEARTHYAAATRLMAASPASAVEGPAMDRVELLRRAADAARFTGDWDQAVTLGREALAHVDPAVEPVLAASLHERLGEYTFWDDAAALESYAEALALLPPACEAERARVLAATALALHYLFRWPEARASAEEALAIARRAGARAEEGYARTTLGTTLAFLGDPEAGEAHVREAKRIAEALGRAEDRVRIHSHLAEVLRIRGLVGEAFAVMVDGEAVAAELGMTGFFGRSMSVNAAEDLLRLGRWEEAEDRLAATGRLELRFAAQLLHHCVSGQLAVARGDVEEATAQLARAREMCSEETSSDYVIGVHVGWAELALWQARPQDARREVADALLVVGEHEDPLYTPVLCSLGVRAEADLAARAGDRGGAESRETAQALVARLRGIVERHSLRVAPVEAVAHLALCEAERSRLDGRSDPEAWRDAADRWERLEQPYPAAYATWRLTEALAAHQRRPDAAAALQRAVATAERLGARPLLAELEVLARAARLPARAEVAPAPAVPSPAARVGLTPREVEILSHVAEGATNRQIAERLYISERTVGVHVSHILAKLDAKNRVGAASAANRLGLLDTSRADG